MYRTKLLGNIDYRNFEPLYEDFCAKSVSEYNFELEPLNFRGFLDSVERKLINCIVVYDEDKLVGFLVYTTVISDAIELNIVHCLRQENFLDYAKELLDKFMELTSSERERKIVCYPMLGEQKNLIGMCSQLGFKFIGTVVLRFKMHATPSKELFKRARVAVLPEDYKVIKWNQRYFEDAVDIIQESFCESSDALFDPRFKTSEGCRDIISKITKNVYADFLPEATSIVLCGDRPVGVVFMNITGGSIVNIPLVGVRRAHQGKGLSTVMLKASMEEILSGQYSGVSEVNTTTETDNIQALKLYKNIGFIEDYDYPQAYLPVKK